MAPGIIEWPAKSGRQSNAVSRSRSTAAESRACSMRRLPRESEREFGERRRFLQRARGSRDLWRSDFSTEAQPVAYCRIRAKAKVAPLLEPPRAVQQGACSRRFCRDGLLAQERRPRILTCSGPSVKCPVMCSNDKATSGSNLPIHFEQSNQFLNPAARAIPMWASFFIAASTCNSIN